MNASQTTYWRIVEDGNLCSPSLRLASKHSISMQPHLSPTEFQRRHDRISSYLHREAYQREASLLTLGLFIVSACIIISVAYGVSTVGNVMLPLFMLIPIAMLITAAYIQGRKRQFEQGLESILMDYNRMDQGHLYWYLQTRVLTTVSGGLMMESGWDHEDGWMDGRSVVAEKTAYFIEVLARLIPPASADVDVKDDVQPPPPAYAEDIKDPAGNA